MDLDPHTKLARAVRKASDEMATPGKTVENAKNRALAGWKGKRTQRPTFVAFAFAAVLVAALLVFLLPPRPAISYVVGTNAEPGTVGAWIAAGLSETPLVFSEGTRVSLAPSARARVTRVDADGAAFLLERGAAHARVVHTSPKTAWVVNAGPFVVNVIGTEFDVSWDPTREVLEVGMIEGKVVVLGPLLGEGRAVSRGEKLRVEVQENRSEVRLLPTPEAEGPRGALRHDEPAQTNETPTSDEAPLAPPAEDDKPTKAGEKTALATDGTHPWEEREKADYDEWQKLAAAGRHEDAMKAVERRGFDAVLAGSSASVSLLLADEARFSGRYTQARKALLHARKLGAKGRSAFLLGKIAADNEGAPAEAVTWFERYLVEEPSGTLSEQALGRVVEIEQRRGHHDKARAAAELYLARHPNGAYASLARAALGP